MVQTLLPLDPQDIADPEDEIFRLTTKDGLLTVEPGAGPANTCLLYTSPSPRDLSTSRMPSSA